MTALPMLISVALPGQDMAESARMAAQIDAAGADMLLLASPRLDPLLLAGWLAPRMKHAALIATLPALHSMPFHVARALSALDFMTGGRSGWSPTTLGHAAQAVCIGPRATIAPDNVGPRGLDFIRATASLWDSWEADALIIDAESGMYLDPDRVRRVHYKGPYFQVMGPLNAARPPQGHPVLVQNDADPLWNLSVPYADILLIGDSATAAARRAEIAQAGSQARLLLKVPCNGGSAVSEIAGEALSLFTEGTIDGVHFIPNGPGVFQTLTIHIIPKLRGPAAADTATPTLRARLGVPNPGCAQRVRT